jgi:hypothetical protein
LLEEDRIAFEALQFSPQIRSVLITEVAIFFQCSVGRRVSREKVLSERKDTRASVEAGGVSAREDSEGPA